MPENAKQLTMKMRVALNCGVARCQTCGTPNWDEGSVCGNCGEDPDKKPSESLPFDPFINQGI